MAQVDVKVKNTVEGQQEVANFGKKLQGNLDILTKSAAAAVAAGAVFKQAFDLSKEGASLNQLTSSFELMNEQVFKTPDLLDEMSNAARGTIKETDLMAGLLTLTAGATDEASRRFAEAAPRLLEIAKASNKLNPSLGDTSFLFDSIALGIKRGSPLILDNLGLQIKLGDANKAYAESLGKTVEQLTAEEKTFALLNATLEAGDQLITQVGGNVDSQVDAWARLEVKISAGKDAFQQWLATGLLPTVDGLGRVTDAVDNGRSVFTNLLIIMGELDPQFKVVNQRYIDQAKVTDDLRNAQEFLAESTDKLIHTQDQSSRRTTAHAEAIEEELTPAIEENTRQLEYSLIVGKDYKEASLAYEVTAEQVAEAEQKRKDAHDAVAAAEQAAAEAARQLAAASGGYFNEVINSEGPLGFFNETLAEMSDRTIFYSNLTGQQREDLKQLQDEYNKTADEIHDYDIGLKGINLSEEERAEKVAALNEELGFYGARISELNAVGGEYANIAGSMTVNQDAVTQAMFDAAVAAEADATELALLGGALGLYSDEAVEAALKTAAIQIEIDRLAELYADGKISISSYREQVYSFIEALDQIPTDKHINVTANFPAIPEWVQAEGGFQTSTGDVGLADGGSFTVPSNFNERAGRPFLAALDGGEHVTVTPAGQQGGMGNNITINSLTIIGSPTPEQTARQTTSQVANIMGGIQ